MDKEISGGSSQRLGSVRRWSGVPSLILSLSNAHAISQEDQTACEMPRDTSTPVPLDNIDESEFVTMRSIPRFSWQARSKEDGPLSTQQFPNEEGVQGLGISTRPTGTEASASIAKSALTSSNVSSVPKEFYLLDRSLKGWNLTARGLPPLQAFLRKKTKKKVEVLRQTSSTPLAGIESWSSPAHCSGRLLLSSFSIVAAIGFGAAQQFSLLARSRPIEDAAPTSSVPATDTPETPLSAITNQEEKRVSVFIEKSVFDDDSDDENINRPHKA